MILTGRQTAQRIIGVLDIGTAKVACLVVALDARGPSILPGMATPFRVLGVGHQRSRGMKAGVITDLDEAEIAVRAAIGQAEEMAGVTLEDVYVSIACGRLQSENFCATAEVGGGTVSDDDIRRGFDGGRAYAERDGRMLVHMNRIGVRLDGAPGGGDPRGLAAAELSLDLHTVTADDAPVRNVMLLVARCHLGVAGIVVAPYASALAATSSEERHLGVTVVDIGAGVTGIAQFAEGQLIHADTVPVGGHHLTFDVARALQTPLVQAERIKALYGTVVAAPSDAHEAFAYPLASDDGEGLTTRAALAEILRPRLKGLLGLAAERLERSGVTAWAGDRVVMTGGCSQLVGIADFTANVLGRPVRVSAPDAASALPGGLAVPTFSTVVGLVAAAANGDALAIGHPAGGLVGQSYLGRVGEWLRQGF